MIFFNIFLFYFNRKNIVVKEKSNLPRLAKSRWSKMELFSILSLSFWPLNIPQKFRKMLPNSNKIIFLLVKQKKA